MCTENQAIAILHEVYDSCNRLFNQKIVDAYLYGSYARGDYHDESDVDIFLTVDAEPDQLASYRKSICQVCSDLSLKYDVLVSPAIQSLRQFRQYQGTLPYYQNIIREGIRYAAG